MFVVAHQPDLCAVRAEQVNTVFDNRVHHRLGVGHRIADNAQHLGGGGLVRARFREFASEGGVGFRGYFGPLVHLAQGSIRFGDLVGWW